MATKLDGAGAIRTVDPRAILRAPPSEGRVLAARFGAGRYLDGHDRGGGWADSGERHAV